MSGLIRDLFGLGGDWSSMTKVPVPMSLATKISNDAVRYAREQMASYGWSNKSVEALHPYPGEGMVGIKTSERYLMYQERGIKPFLMTWVQGRTLPMGCKGGDGPHFRRGGHVGEPGYVNIPHLGQVWRDQKWRHPGIQGRGFMQAGLQKAIEQNQGLIKQYANNIIKGGRK